jgi:alkyl hydroperoxide reductase subunit F
MSDLELSDEIIKTLIGYTASMKKAVTFVVQSGNHSRRPYLLAFLSSIASTSDQLTLEERELSGVVRGPLSFILETENEDTGIIFSGIPSGHEFNSLILATLQSGGAELKLDDSIKDIVSGIEDSLKFEVFISLSCHNCPDVVQALNQFALLNKNITTEMIDGGLYPELIKDRDIQGVPCVYLNGELFAHGKIEISQLLGKLPTQISKRQNMVSEILPTQDVTIIGGGPAGISAAIYSARKGLKVTLIAEKLGGQVKDTLGIENLISIQTTTGSKLTNSMHTHMNDYEVTVKEHVGVTEIFDGKIKTIKLSTGETIRSKTLILATGASWRELGIPGEKEYIGNGVAYCPHCDGPFFKGMDVAVIGSGNSGIEASLDLAGIVKSVTIFEFEPNLKADAILLDQTLLRKNIQIRKNVAPKKILGGNGKVTAIEYEDRVTGKILLQSVNGIFVQIGLIPNSQLFEETLDMNSHGEVIIDSHCRTSAAGIFACGDVTTVPYKQIVISMGEGSKAALSASDYLLKNLFDNDLAQNEKAA